MTTNASTHRHPNYVGIFWALLILTIIEVCVAYTHLAHGLKVAGLLTLAITKALLVALYYMHLKFDRRLLALIALAPFLLLSAVGLLLYVGIGVLR